MLAMSSTDFFFQNQLFQKYFRNTGDQIGIQNSNSFGRNGHQVTYRLNKIFQHLFRIVCSNVSYVNNGNELLTVE